MQIRSKIKGEWRLTHLSASNEVIKVYQFPEIFLNNFFNAFNTAARHPCGQSNLEAMIKFGYSQQPVNLDGNSLIDQAVLPVELSENYDYGWPEWSSGDYKEQIDEEGNTYHSHGRFKYNAETGKYYKISGGYLDAGIDSLGNPSNKSHFFIKDTYLTAPLAEIGVAIPLGYDLDNLLTNGTHHQFMESWRTPSSPVVSSRSLILDENGVPTTITLSEGEKIKVERLVVVEFEIPPVKEHNVRISNTQNSDVVSTLCTMEMTDPSERHSFIKNNSMAVIASVNTPTYFEFYDSFNRSLNQITSLEPEPVST